MAVDPLGIVGLLPLLCSPFQMVDEGRFERLVTALAHDLGRRSRDEHFPGMHQRDAVAALRLVHEVSGNEDRHAVAARQFEQEVPEPVARHRVDPRGRLVEDQYFRSMDDGGRERQPLPMSQGQ